MTTSLPLADAGLRAFPPEIREMIFHFSNCLIWTGKTPAILVALRGDPDLYHEALELFYRRNVFRLRNRNAWQTADMSLSALQTIRALIVEFWSAEDDEEGYAPQIIEPPTHAFHKHPILQASSCRSVHFDVSALSEYDMSVCLLPAVACALRLPYLECITVGLPRIYYHRSGDPYDCMGNVGRLVGGLNRALGLSGKLVTVGIGGGEVWFWQGEGNRFLREYAAIVEGATGDAAEN